MTLIIFGFFFLGLWLRLGLLVLRLGLGLGFFKLVRNSVSVFVSVFAFQVMSMFDFGDKNSIFRAEISPKFSGPLQSTFAAAAVFRLPLVC